MKNKQTFHILYTLLQMVRPLRFHMILAILAGTAGFLCAIAIPVTGMLLMAQAAGLLPAADWKILTAILVFSALARGVLRYGEQACNHFIAFKLLAHIRDLVFGKLRTLGPGRLEGKKKGDLIAMLTSDVELLEVFFAHTISPVCIAVLVCTLFTAAASFIHPWAGLLLAVSYLSVGVVLPLLSSAKSTEAGKAYRNLAGDLTGFVLECTRGLQPILQFQGRERMQAQLQKKTELLAVQEKKLKAMQAFNTSAVNTLVLFFSVVMLFLAGRLVQTGAISLVQGLLLSIMQISTFSPVIALSSLSTTLSQTIGAAHRVISVLEEQPSIVPVLEGRRAETKKIQLENVAFKYEEENILNQLSAQFEKGQVSGVCGKSGCGKSTMLRLLMRFYDPQSGTILLSDADLKTIENASLRASQSFVMQETFLFHDTIENNLKLANPNAGREEMEQACRMAGIHDFILSLPEGYQTQIGEAGSTLSAGEKQRISLARAFLHQGKILLLDEPTSNLDSLNEGMILKAVDEQKKDRLTILVSHRKSTLGFCDRVMEMEAA